MRVPEFGYIYEITMKEKFATVSRGVALLCMYEEMKKKKKTDEGAEGTARRSSTPPCTCFSRAWMLRTLLEEVHTARSTTRTPSMYNEKMEKAILATLPPTPCCKVRSKAVLLAILGLLRHRPHHRLPISVAPRRHDQPSCCPHANSIGRGPW